MLRVISHFSFLSSEHNKGFPIFVPVKALADAAFVFFICLPDLKSSPKKLFPACIAAAATPAV